MYKGFSELDLLNSFQRVLVNLDMLMSLVQDLLTTVMVTAAKKKKSLTQELVKHVRWTVHFTWEIWCYGQPLARNDQKVVIIEHLFKGNPVGQSLKI